MVSITTPFRFDRVSRRRFVHLRSVQRDSTGVRPSPLVLRACPGCQSSRLRLRLARFHSAAYSVGGFGQTVVLLSSPDGHHELPHRSLPGANVVTRGADLPDAIRPRRPRRHHFTPRGTNTQRSVQRSHAVLPSLSPSHVHACRLSPQTPYCSCRHARRIRLTGTGLCQRAS